MDSAPNSDNRNFASDDGENENNAIARLSDLARQNKINSLASHQELIALAFEKPVSAEGAWGQFGFLLGIIPPAAIFSKLFSYGFTLDARPTAFLFALLFLAMNFVCALTGRRIASGLSQIAIDYERRSWSLMLIVAPVLGATWGAVTGFVGGLLFFGIGAVGGIIFATPIGLCAFTLFAVFHRLIQFEGFAERKHVLPISTGICLAIAAFILGS